MERIHRMRLRKERTGAEGMSQISPFACVDTLAVWGAKDLAIRRPREEKEERNV